MFRFEALLYSVPPQPRRPIEEALPPKADIPPQLFRRGRRFSDGSAGLSSAKCLINKKTGALVHPRVASIKFDLNEEIGRSGHKVKPVKQAKPSLPLSIPKEQADVIASHIRRMH